MANPVLAGTFLCRLADLADGSARGFDPGRSGQDTLLVVRQGDDLFGWLDACPHEGTPMAWRKDAYLGAGGRRIVCHAHGAQFDVRSGLCTLGPCLGQALTPVRLQRSDDGDICLAPRDATETAT